jgi:hypothetical protein
MTCSSVLTFFFFFQAFSFFLYSVVFLVTVLSFRKGLYRIQLIQLAWTLMTLTGNFFLGVLCLFCSSILSQRVSLTVNFLSRAVFHQNRDGAERSQP